MKKLLFLLLFFTIFITSAQKPEKLNSAEIYKNLEKLNFLGSALYIAAHPDDENTRLISYLSNNLGARTAYLSLTRGDGGQNLIGPELRELLGIIRTQELLKAREIDGGIQFFTRANDFGYSKTPKETLEIWNEKEVLSDVVWVVRKFKPDVIINRFEANSAGETHGHHTASAILSQKAFQLANEPSAFPKQLEYVNPWQPKKLFFNTSSWFYEDKQVFDQAKDKFLTVDTGVFYPLLGLSNTEIASLSRSSHRSQGFGSTGTRGSNIEYLDAVAGHDAKKDSIFSGINTTWSRLKNGETIGKILTQVQENYNFKDPAASLPGLIKAYKLIQDLENEHWRKIKTEEIKEIIAAAAGLYLEAVASTPLATPGSEISLKLEAINRSPQKMKLSSVEILPVRKEISPEIPMENNIDWQKEIKITIPDSADLARPYWLEQKGTLGMYKVKDQSLIGLPETPEKFKAEFNIQINGTRIPFTREIVFKRNDPVKGEVYRPFSIVPKVSLSTKNDVEIFAKDASEKISVSVESFGNNIKGKLTLEVPEGWAFSPENYNFSLAEKGEEKIYSFQITPPEGSSEGILKPVAVINGEEFSSEVIQIEYEHIPQQTLVLPELVKVVKLNIQKKGELVGYIRGAGDVVPEALEQMGYEVVFLDPQQLSAENLMKFDAIVTGIRAYNVVEELRYQQEELLEYVKNGGNLIVQYNTSHRLITEDIAPFPLQMSRDRVTDENSEVEFLAPEHPVLNEPNKITKADFEGWVQERGLYFPNEWSEEFTPIFSMRDPSEDPKKGSLLITKYGEGHFIYTGLSFFREFPAGVPGAFRLFANLVSLGVEEN